MRILFAGSPAIAVPSLKVLSEMEPGLPMELGTPAKGSALEGILFIDRISEQKRNRILAKIEKAKGKQRA